MDVGVVLSGAGAPNFVEGAVAQAREAREAGVASAWLGQRLDYDAAALAAVIGHAVPGLTVGTSAIPIFGRQPVLVAGQALTAQAAAGGRFQLGLALGAKPLVESTFGITYERPVALLAEFLTALRALLTDGTADFRGELLSAAPPLPVALPGAERVPPLLVAAMGPQALRVTGELADGTLPFLAGPRALGEHIVPALTAAAEAAGRPAPRVVALVPAVVTAEVARVREVAAREMEFYESIPSYRRVLELSGAERAGEIAVVGDEETVAAEVRRYRNAGATEVVLTQTSMGGEAARRRTWRLAGELTRT
ncbi:TIGR03564 family F420-dependent LLM class oxidoreductase [Streptomyces sp. 3MP-14]|uniref:TIGR03564 family F420-dependent LLM class oxidoreductase n=1 Tax=Streptomyces mimosae TaxID=2586635 RepID=A0A5N6ACM8_9ACTN|nr:MULTISPECIES: TIGR03564 family F420-dependent LLM class oxidoreductase [Streptomyces]KAB8165813.1 TIGR03564 family F420-dependent LLM class oxidoreductase [Streptomyces mimosae]KAB8176202.1 TIGR03564 family F420-dependent LLM class oxidoreductase [Streptomyces sp. 3MP-14]